MFNVILYQPEIPPNTGNIIRLCANSGCRLHLVRPLGFELEHAKLRRAGLDYHEWASVVTHDSLAGCRETLDGRWFAFSTRATRLYASAAFQAGDCLLFGPETRGLPQSCIDDPTITGLRLPMRPESRSLNLSNAVAVVVYEALRQQGFSGLG
jgi:tRNA (cytidine/uridine-2'-O-)-methyltransferase